MTSQQTVILPSNKTVYSIISVWKLHVSVRFGTSSGFCIKVIRIKVKTVNMNILSCEMSQLYDIYYKKGIKTVDKIVLRKRNNEKVIF